MPFRCRGYDDDGNAISGGCRSLECCFVHPSDVSWSRAIRAGETSSDLDFQFKPRLGEANGKGRREGREASQNASIGKSFCGSGKTGTGGPRPIASDYPSSWDTPSKNTQSKSTAWSSGLGSAAINRDGDGSVTASSADAISSGDQKRCDATGTGVRDDVTNAGGWEGSGGWKTSGEVGGDTNTIQNASDRLPATATTNREVNDIAIIPKPTGREGTFASTDEVRILDGNNVSLSLLEETSFNSIDVDWSGVPRHGHEVIPRAVSPAATEQMTISTLHSTPSVNLTDRRQVFATVIKMTNSIVEKQLKLREAQSQLEHWKATQLSPQFAHVSRAARAKLDNVRSTYEKQVSDANSRLTRALTRLAELPELSRITPKVFNADLDARKVIMYTEELKEWIVDLRAHLSAMTASPVSPQPTPLTHQGSSEDQSNDNSSSAKRQRLDQGYGASWTWVDLKLHVDQLEAKIELVADQLDEVKVFHAFTTLTDGNEDTAGHGHAETRTIESPRVVPNPILGLSQHANSIGKELENQAVLTADLLLKIHKGEEMIKLLEAQKQEHESIKSQVETRLQQFEKWRQEDSEQIRQLSEQIHNLQARSRPSLAALVPIIGGISAIPEIDMKIRATLQQEVLPALETLRGESCSHIRKQHECAVHETLQKLRPTLDMTESICQRIELEMNSKYRTQQFAIL